MPFSIPIPLRSNYKVSPIDQTVRTDMEFGAARMRRRTSARLDTVSVEWLFSPDDMAGFRAWFDYDIAGGAAWFDLTLNIGDGIDTVTARFTQPWSCDPVGFHWKVSGELEVRKIHIWYAPINALKLPSLELDFAGTKSLAPVIRSLAQPTPSVTFTRSSVATYFGADGLLKLASVNEPRFDHDPVTGECKGLLIEEARPNLLTYSEQFDNAVWGKTATSVTLNTTTAPDGTVTADKLVEDTSTGGRVVIQSVSGIADSTTVTVSCFVKSAGRDWVALTVVDKSGTLNRVWFNLTTGLQGSINGTVSAFSVVALGNGWYRLAVSASSSTGAGSVQTRISIGSADNTASYAGDGTSGLYLWGAQLEVGSFPTSYIATTTSQVTRAADVAQMTGANFSSWYRQDEGTVLAKWDAQKLQINYCPWGISDGTFANTLVEAGVTSTGTRILSSNANVSQINTSFGAIDPTQLTRTAVAYKNNDAAFAQNGGAVLTDTSCTLPTTLNKLRIGDAGYFTSKFCGHIAKFTYYPKRLSNNELQALSA